MLAELVDHVIGIDPDRDWITAAIVDAKTTGVIANAKFAGEQRRLRRSHRVGRHPHDGRRSQLGCGGIRQLRTWPERRAVTCR